jgi:hypothetical protein
MIEHSTARKAREQETRPLSAGDPPHLIQMGNSPANPLLSVQSNLNQAKSP